MFTSFDIWKILAGVAIFLIGIKFLEESLQELAGRRFKLFLKKQTRNKLKAIGGGAIVTAVLQSSSVVGLMVLAFVGAGIIQMQNALAIILGANLGTTISNWIVALVGFKVNIEMIALPVTGLAGLGYVIFNRSSALHNWSRFLLGFSFLFVGLGYIKTGIENVVQHVDLAEYDQSPVIVFFLIGFIITTVIQSSAATMAITLSALYAGAINLYDAMAITLGSEVGTTIKLFIASIKGSAVKKRVALGNFLINIITVSIVMIILLPIYRLVTEAVGIKDKLVSLVFFQSLINVFSIILFYPLLNVLGRFLENRFRSADDETMFIHKVDVKEPSTALDALEKETNHFIKVICNYALSCFEISYIGQTEIRLNKKYLDNNILEKYDYIKFLYGEIHSYYIKMQKTTTNKEDVEKLDRFMSSNRNAMYAAKSFKDALPDKEQLQNSSNEIKFAFYKETRAEVEKFCKLVQEILKERKQDYAKELTAIYKSVTAGYTTTLQHLYQEGTAGKVNETEITTMLNFNREIFTGFKSLVFAAKDYLLDRDLAKHFDELPGFIR
ncbi:MAG TPA: Na/Pi symporter [Chitinophagaceae bacterium]|nr:Na/Pi symporter [Chitinophagaceae bacterium]